MVDYIKANEIFIQQYINKESIISDEIKSLLETESDDVYIDIKLYEQFIQNYIINNIPLQCPVFNSIVLTIEKQIKLQERELV